MALVIVNLDCQLGELSGSTEKPLHLTTVSDNNILMMAPSLAVNSVMLGSAGNKHRGNPWAVCEGFSRLD